MIFKPLPLRKLLLLLAVLRNNIKKKDQIIAGKC